MCFQANRPQFCELRSAQGSWRCGSNLANLFSNSSFSGFRELTLELAQASFQLQKRGILSLGPRPRQPGKKLSISWRDSRTVGLAASAQGFGSSDRRPASVLWKAGNSFCSVWTPIPGVHHLCGLCDMAIKDHSNMGGHKTNHAWMISTKGSTFKTSSYRGLYSRQERHKGQGL